MKTSSVSISCTSTLHAVFEMNKDQWIMTQQSIIMNKSASIFFRVFSYCFFPQPTAPLIFKKKRFWGEKWHRTTSPPPFLSKKILKKIGKFRGKKGKIWVKSGLKKKKNRQTDSNLVIIRPGSYHQEVQVHEPLPSDRPHPPVHSPPHHLHYYHLLLHHRYRPPQSPLEGR